MTGKIFGLNGTMLNSSQEYKEQLVNELIRLTSVASVPVISRIVATPPTSGLTPDSYYIVPTGATGAWAGKANQIAFPLIGVNGQPNGDWGFWLPFLGLKVSLISGDNLFFNGANWQTVAGAGDMLVAEYGGSATGIVAKADEIAGNPSNDTFYGKESGNKGFFGFFPKVLSTPLTALNVTTGGAITATDNILQAFGKLQNQINSINDSTEQYSGDIEAPIVQTYPLDFALLRGYNILSFSAVTESGTATISVRINGINIPGLNNLSITSTRLTVSVTTGNLLGTGSRLELVVSAVSNSKHLFFTIGRKYV